MLLSPLAQGRELKYYFCDIMYFTQESPLAQGRELISRCKDNAASAGYVAPRTGTRIEMALKGGNFSALKGRLSRRGVN